MRAARWFLGAIAVACFATAARAVPIVPTRDDEVIEVLPTLPSERAEEKRLRGQLAQRPQDPALALSAARRYLSQAHATGDPRYAGMALATLAAWPDDATMPDDLLMMKATLQQYLHAFDASATNLQRLVGRPGQHPQAWLTLATVRRVQGRYLESDAACAQVARAGAALHANACIAENLALRGETDKARGIFAGLLGGARVPPETEAWLTTSVAELEQRAGRPAAAEAAFRKALALDPDPYTTLDLADLLIEQRRPAEALAVLKDQTRSDPVLLRLAIAGTQGNAASAPADVAEMRDRIALANERPDAKVLHGREQAMFALEVEHDPARALELARGNVAQQREPLDLLVYARAARASGQAAARQDAARVAAQVGLVDTRTQAALQ